MRASAKLFRIHRSVASYHFINPDDVGIFFPKGSFHPPQASGIFILLMDRNGKIRLDGSIYVILHPFDFLFREFGRMGEIEPQAFRGNVRTRLMHVVSENGAQSRKHQMARRMKRYRVARLIPETSFEFSGGSGSGKLLMPFQRLLKFIGIHAEVLLFCEFHSHLEGKPVRVEKCEGFATGKFFPLIFP